MMWVVASPIEPWVDAELSAALPDLCRRGEGQDLEFKRQLPEQAHDIGKSIAAFASSGSGRVFYGVGDDGEILGLAEAALAKVRDTINQRISGAAKEVKPPVHPEISWAMHGDRVVCVVSVKKGFDAIYYSKHRPIIRRGATSRPAEPGEVEKAFRDRYASTAVAAPLPSTLQMATRLQTVLARMNDARRDEPLAVGDLAMALRLGSPAELDAVMSGQHAPSFELIDRFCDRFAVDKDWVVSGRGSPFKPPIEHEVLPELYAPRIEEAAPEIVYAVRSRSDIGEAFFVIYCDEFKAWRVPDVWHVSDHVGGGGSRDLLSLYRLFKSWIGGSKQFMVLGRLVEPKLAEAVINNEVHPCAVASGPVSHWWDDLTDLDHRWTTRQGLQKAYGKGFVLAQDIIKNQLGVIAEIDSLRLRRNHGDRAS